MKETLIATGRRSCVSSSADALQNLGFNHANKRIYLLYPTLKHTIDGPWEVKCHYALPSAVVWVPVLPFNTVKRDAGEPIERMKPEQYRCRNKRTKLAIKKRRRRLGERVSLRY